MLAGLTSLFNNGISNSLYESVFMANRFSSAVKKINSAPVFLRSFLLTKLFSTTVKYAGTTGIKINEVSNEQVLLSIKNRKSVQNHIGGVHAIAAALLAESATGIVFGMNVPDNKLPLLKSMTINYRRRMQGNLTAVATLSPEQIQKIEQDEKGDMDVRVVISDESGQEPIDCLMGWAWVTKREK